MHATDTHSTGTCTTAHAGTRAAAPPPCDAGQDGALQRGRLDGLALDGEDVAAADLLQVPVWGCAQWCGPQVGSDGGVEAKGAVGKQACTGVFGRK